MQSQTTIFVNSASAKLLVVKKEDKSFLEEGLKQSIDKAVLDMNFKDFDRPLINKREIK